MQALSMIDRGAKAPETVVPVKSADPQSKPFGKVLGEQHTPEPVSQKDAGKAPAKKTATGGNGKDEQSVQQQPVEPKGTADKPQVSTDASTPGVTPVKVAAPAGTAVQTGPDLQQLLVSLMQTIAAGDAEPADAKPADTESGSMEKLLTRLVQQLDGSELKGEQVVAGIDLSALAEQLQKINTEGDDEQLKEQLVGQLKEQLANEQGLAANAELAAALLPITDPQATAPKLIENLGRARQLLQQAIDSVTMQKVPQEATAAAVAIDEPVATDEPVAKTALLSAAETAEPIDPRFAGLLKPRSEKHPSQQPLHEAVRGHNATVKSNPAAAVTEAVPPPSEGPPAAHKAAEFVEQLARGPKPALDNLVQQAQGQTHPAAAVQTQGLDGGKLMPQTPTVQLPSGQQVAESQIFDQVVARFSGSFNGESGRMVLRLQPAELGSLKLDLMVEGDRIRANIHAQSLQVREVLERHLPQLRNALAEQGLKIDQFQVNVNQEQSRQNPFDQPAQQQQHQQHNASHAQPRWQPLRDAEEQIIPLAHLMQNGGGGISLRV